MTIGDADIIPFPTAHFDSNRAEAEREELPVRTGHKEHYCLHDHTTIYENRRELACRDCEAVLDPIEWLVRYARQRENEVFRVQRLRKEIDRLERRLADLKRDERNAKARLRTAKRKAEA